MAQNLALTPRSGTGDGLTGTSDDYGASGQFKSVGKLRQMYLDYLMSKRDEIDEQQVTRRYYHGAQWTAKEVEILRKRGQLPTTHNHLARKVNSIVGLTMRNRQDPKAYPNTPAQEQGAEIATQVVRAVLQGSDWETREVQCCLQCAIEGIAGVELKLVQGDKGPGDPDIALQEVLGDDFFYDPKSVRFDFEDARYKGVAKWIEVDEAIELFPDHEDDLEGLMEDGSDLSTVADREFKWLNVQTKRVRMVEIWYKHRSRWCWAFFVGTLLLEQGVSPFFDERGRTMARFIMFSAAVDHDGDRYGFPRNLQSAQDEVNHRYSKALHISNSRRIISEKGAVNDVEVARREWARPDGWVEVNPGKKIEPDQTQQDLAAQLQFLQEAKGEIDAFANTNIASMTQSAAGLQNLSGRAVNLLQQPGLSEIGIFLLAYRGWKMRVYRAIWGAAQRYWTSERWIRVTDDEDLAQFIQLNGLDLDEWGRPALVNALGALDVDISMDEGPDVINMMADTFETLRNMPPGSVPPQVLIEMSPMQGSVKKRLLKMMQPQVDPNQAITQKLTIEGIAASNEAAKAAAMEKRAKGVLDVFSAAEKATKAGLNAQEAEMQGMQTAPIAPPQPPANPFAGQPGPLPQPGQVPPQPVVAPPPPVNSPPINPLGPFGQ